MEFGVDAHDDDVDALVYVMLGHVDEGISSQEIQHGVAQMRAEEEMRCEERLRAVAEVNRTLNELTVYREQRAKKNKKHGRPAPADARYEKVLMLLAEVALKRWTSLQ